MFQGREFSQLKACQGTANCIPFSRLLLIIMPCNVDMPPGMILTAAGLLLKNQSPSRQEIVDALEDNLCRCGAHEHIIDAVEAASKVMKGGNSHEKRS
jgi:hypothetical protein